MNAAIDVLISWKRNIISLFVIPVILIGCIYISYGEIFDSLLVEDNVSSSFVQLKKHYDIFNNDIYAKTLEIIPSIVLNIGFYSIIFIYCLFAFWIVTHTFSNYLKLSLGQSSKILMLLELIAILVIYLFFVNPGLNLFLSLGGYSIITLDLLLIIVYSLYELKNKK